MLIEQIGAQSDLTPQVGKQVARVQLFVDTDVAAVVKLLGVKVPALDESLGQHQGWAREFCVWNQQTFRRDPRRTSIARSGGARQDAGGLGGSPSSPKRKPLAR